ncbi:hypothetical protein BD626DRAFT_491028 [Schizophyllum amplum]|uniref:Uncharacterized protein n=1 Tax=Schizophyllum amplum TaxID=97359 RepID=A0A550CK23_9AGAR|nr:hypothetical protein BD626DRAFT_491028 [Auriculariopsis ampla]
MGANLEFSRFNTLHHLERSPAATYISSRAIVNVVNIPRAGRSSSSAVNIGSFAVILPALCTSGIPSTRLIMSRACMRPQFRQCQPHSVAGYLRQDGKSDRCPGRAPSRQHRLIHPCFRAQARLLHLLGMRRQIKSRQQRFLAVVHLLERRSIIYAVPRPREATFAGKYITLLSSTTKNV